MRFCRSIWIFVTLAISVTGCDWIPAEGQKYWSQLRLELNSLNAVLSGSPIPSPSPSPSTSSQTSEDPHVAEGKYSSVGAKNAVANGEIMQELLRVVFEREPRSSAEFGNWVDTLNQGASFEGVYNGITHSDIYRREEILHAGASAEALRIFGEELAYLEIELPNPTQFDPLSASPLPSLNENEPSSETMEIDFPRLSPSPTSTAPLVTPGVNLRPMMERYSRIFVVASFFTLKRVLGEEALKVIDAKGQYAEKLALWYSKWAVRLSQRRVDFGLTLRNRPDEAFHYKWALETSSDRLKWEVLNRLHRVLNEANRQKQ